MTLINLTPHTVVIHCGDTVLTLPSSGLARAVPMTVPYDTIVIGNYDHTITVVTTVLGEVTGLPPHARGVGYVVSGIVLDHPDTAGRTDLYAPGELIRGSDGQPIGCRGLRARA